MNIILNIFDQHFKTKSQYTARPNLSLHTLAMENMKKCYSAQDPTHPDFMHLLKHDMIVALAEPL